MINSPFKWVGGKSRLRKSIIPLIPAHQCYVEPFGGAAWVLFGKPLSPIEVLNDIDEELINFFRVVRHQPEELIKSFDLELVSRSEFQRLADGDPKVMSDVERAHRFYYLIMAGWGGEALYPRFQTSTSDGGHGNRLIGALKTLRRRIEPVHDRLKTVIIENLDWAECIERYDRPASFIYLDSPYPGNGANYRHNMRLMADHSVIAERLRGLQCKWMLSSYDTEEVRAKFQHYNIVQIQSSSGMRSAESEARSHGRKRTMNREILVLNYDPSIEGAALQKESLEYAPGQATMFERSPSYDSSIL
jgi:DNA adenine methylase